MLDSLIFHFFKQVLWMALHTLAMTDVQKSSWKCGVVYYNFALLHSRQIHFYCFQLS